MPEGKGSCQATIGTFLRDCHFEAIEVRLESTVCSKIGMHGVIGDRMVGSWSDMNQGSRTGKGTAFMVSCRGPEELCPGGDRASVVAKKRGNARGVKGGRKVEA